MRFGSTDKERIAKKRTKYLSKPTDVIWFAWRPVRFDNNKWAFWERVRCTREIHNEYGEEWSVKRWKYMSKPTDVIWFAWRPVRFDNDKWAFWERVRRTREILNDYGEKWSVERWKYHPIDIPNDEDLHDHLRTSQEPDNRDG